MKRMHEMPFGAQLTTESGVRFLAAAAEPPGHTTSRSHSTSATLTVWSVPSAIETT